MYEQMYLILYYIALGIIKFIDCILVLVAFALIPIILVLMVLFMYEFVQYGI